MWNDSLWLQTMKFLNSLLYNAMFDWQIYKFILKASVQKLLANKEIKRKSGFYFGFLILNWKVLSSQTFRVFL